MDNPETLATLGTQDTGRMLQDQGSVVQLVITLIA